MPDLRPARLAPASFWVRGGAMVAARPSLWATAARQAGRLARREWWRRPPFLPLPDRDYLRFRFETQYGSGRDTRPDPKDLVAYLEWCRDLREPRRARRSRR